MVIGRNLDETVGDFLKNNSTGRASFRTTVDLDEANFKAFKLFCKYKGVKVGDLLDVFIDHIIKTNMDDILKYKTMETKTYK